MYPSLSMINPDPVPEIGFFCRSPPGGVIPGGIPGNPGIPNLLKNS